MAGMATAQILGNLVKDPESRDAGKSRVANFTLAVNGRRGDADYVSYFDCQAWGRLADVVMQYLQKGRQVLVAGELQQDRWEKDGVKHSRVRLNVANMQMIGSGGGRRQNDDGGESHLPNGDHGDDLPSDTGGAPF